MIRPGDPNEVAACWRAAIERADGPVALLLSRQNMPVLDRSDLADAAEAERGGYVLWESARAPLAQLVLLATGAELAPTLEAGRALAQDARRCARGLGPRAWTSSRP